METLKISKSGGKHILAENKVPKIVSLTRLTKFINDHKLDKYTTIDQNGDEVEVSFDLEKSYTINKIVIDKDEFSDFDYIPFKIKKIIGASFYIRSQHIKSLYNFPEYIYRNLVFSNVPITTTAGCPKDVGSNLEFEYCENLTKLEDIPDNIFGTFSIMGCENLTSLEGSPKTVGETFNCSYSGIKNLKGLPKQIKTFNCENCSKLISTKGSGNTIILGNVFLSHCINLEDVSEFPRYTGSLYIKGCEKLNERQIKYMISRKMYE